MASQLKSDTARANGAKSRGPKTAAGKEKSSQNSLKHGFTSRQTILLECENPDDLSEMLDEYAVMHSPATPAEQDLVDEMVASRWRIRRIRVVETILFDCEMVRRRPEVEKEFLNPDPGMRFALAFQSLTERSRSIALISRYESRLQRAHDRAYRTLREIQKTRKPGEPESPEPTRKTPAPVAKTDETNPNERAAIDRALARIFPTVIPEFNAMEVLNNSVQGIQRMQNM